jgi:type I restriction enzyme S subunit
MPVAPYNEQKRIVAEIEKQFSRLDEAVENLKRVKANLKRYKAAVLKAAVEGKLVEQWRKEHPGVEPASELLKRILTERKKKWEADHPGKKYKEPASPDTSNLPALPKGWVWATLEQLHDDALIGLDRGRSQQSDKPGGIPYIKMNNITMDGKVILNDLVYVKTTSEEIFRFNVKDGDLLFNTRNSKELVGKVGLVKNLYVEAIYNNSLMRIRMPNSVKSNFICAQMCSLEFRRRMELVKKATTNVAAIYAKDLFPLPIALPSSYEQGLIMAEVERLLSVADEIEIAIEFNLKRAERLHQAILKKAFSGKLVK